MGALIFPSPTRKPVWIKASAGRPNGFGFVGKTQTHGKGSPERLQGATYGNANKPSQHIKRPVTQRHTGEHEKPQAHDSTIYFSSAPTQVQEFYEWKNFFGGGKSFSMSFRLAGLQRIVLARPCCLKRHKNREGRLERAVFGPGHILFPSALRFIFFKRDLG